MNNRHKIILTALIFFCLSLIITRPLIYYFNRGIPYTRTPEKGWEVQSMQQGDHLQLYYHFWLARDALRGEHPFFFDPYEFSVDGIKIFTVRRFPLSIPFVIFSFLGGAFAYNLVLILSIIFSGIAMFLLARIYLQRYFPSFIAALIYTLAPFSLSQLLGGHTNGFLWGIAPLAVFSIERLFASGKWKFALIYFFCLFTCALIEYHLLYYLTLFTLIWLPIRTVTSLANWKAENLNVKTQLFKSYLPVFLSLFIVFIFAMFLKDIEISSSIAQKGRRLSEVSIYSPQIKDLFCRGNTDSEKNIYAGGVALSLAFLGLIFNLFRSGKGIKVYEEKINLLFFSAGLIISLILALGTNLSDVFPVYNFCYKYIPYFNYPRVPGRIIVINFMCLAILSGYGIRGIVGLFDRISKTGLRRAVLILTGIFFSGAVFFDYNADSKIGISLFDKDNGIYKIVRENAGDKKLLELPLWPGDTAWSSIYLYYVTITRVKIINGYYPLVPQEYVDKIFYPLISLNLGDLTESEYELLQRLQVKYIIFHENAFPQKVSHYPSSYSVNRLMDSSYLDFIAHDNFLWLFEVRNKPLLKEKEVQKIWEIGVVKWAHQLKHRVGRLVPDPEAEGGEALFASRKTDRPGYLIFGRQQVFPRGHYKAIFRLKTDDNTIDKPVAVLDIKGGDNSHGVSEIKEIKGTAFEKPGVYQDFIIYFDEKAPLFLEFHLNYLSQSNIWVECIYILPAEESDPLFTYEAEKLYYRGVVVDDKEASDGKAILFSRGFTPEKEVLFGPYRRYSKGAYRISFRLKTDHLSKSSLAQLEVATDLGRKKAGQKVISGTDFKKAGTYQNFSFPFNLERDKILEFRLIYEGENKIWADLIEIEKETIK